MRTQGTYNIGFVTQLNTSHKHHHHGELFAPPSPTTWEQCTAPIWHLGGHPKGSAKGSQLNSFVDSNHIIQGFYIVDKKRFIKHINACAKLLWDNEIASYVTSSCAHPRMTWYITTVSKLSPFNNGMYDNFLINSPTPTSKWKTL
jgi:hypothetical protein